MDGPALRAREVAHLQRAGHFRRGAQRGQGYGRRVQAGPAVDRIGLCFSNYFSIAWLIFGKL